MTDGRHNRAVRSKAAALEACRRQMMRGNFQPTMAAVALSAGVSVRTVFQHFGDVETMRKEALDDATETAILQSLFTGHEWSLSLAACKRVVLAAVLGRAP